MTVRPRGARVRRSRPPLRRRSSRGGGWLLLGVLAVLLFGSGVLVGRRTRSAAQPSRDADSRGRVEESARGEGSPRRVEPAPRGRAEAARRGAAEEVPPHRGGEAGALERGRAEMAAEPADPPAPLPVDPDRPAYLALVIDDLGRRLEDVDALDSLGVDLSYAVLPFEARTDEVVARLRREGVEILLHLPMEPDGDADPGPGALRRSMGERELAESTRAALDAVPGAVGVNNHMGSALSADDRSMAVILAQVEGRELYYLDSRTSPQSVGFELAVRRGIPAARRDVFLDGVVEASAIRDQFRRWLNHARETGAAVAIAHPHAETLAVLREEVPRARGLGYRFVPVSYLVERAGGE